MVDLKRLTANSYQLCGGSNAGLLVHEDRAVLVDTGLDRDTAKKILRTVDAQGLKISAIAITHAHADHFGGAATIRARTGASVFAPPLEAAIIANPILEPLYLFSGAWPAAELLHKFTLAEACPVDGLLTPETKELGGVPLEIIPAPGHAPGQVMVAGGGACFVADAVFAPEVLGKHGVPFYTDVDQTLATHDRLAQMEGTYETFVPGHGDSVPGIAALAATNRARVEEIRAQVRLGLDQSADLGGLVEYVAGTLGLTIPNPVIYWLTQTTILACLRSLQAAGRAQVTVTGNRLAWRAT